MYRWGTLNVMVRLIHNYFATAVVRVAAAVHHTLGPIMEEIKKDIATIKNDIDTLNERICKNDDCYTCGDTGGWRRAVYLDMTDPNTNCPSGWNMTGYSKRTCGRANSSSLSCDSVFFPVSGGPFSQVCGRIRAYQYGVPEAFSAYNYEGQSTISSAYVSGVALIYGSPQQHIWTFAVGAWENDTRHQVYNCPCDTTGVTSVPPFVGDDYFCESGYVFSKYRNNTDWYRIHSNDTLWDGRDCHSTSTMSFSPQSSIFHQNPQPDNY